ncbi:glycoside hydrolase superfamily [Kockovaella imperatae]|uniref:Glycoside hydrolase superfamily n=1 Tax=Kockovaella imperatae TaxID=4999 RepID=A0A1Y1UEY6_9TREE|nr:glycoside hydrolase superfamily [Kockovaella imperatae]ORX36578.1 glycoside hydrolase superfamily [Kockovaella imperatae]
MRSSSLPSLLIAWLCLLRNIAGLSTWYTPPGGPPTGSTVGDKVRGINLGGWFILENWMMPDFVSVPPLDQYDIPDEWTYCSVLGKEECSNRLTQHWSTYIDESDFIMFKEYGLNTVRIPMGYWAWIDILGFEPYINGQTTYLDQALEWAKKYNIDVLMDMHGLPGGQNGQDNQGYKGPIEMPNNSSNTERGLQAIEAMTKHVTDPKFGGVVKAIELVNEPHLTPMYDNGMSWDFYAGFLVQAYQAVRSSETVMQGNHEVMVVVHDAFQPILNWQYFWSEPSLGLNWTNYALDSHYYDAFGDAANKTYQEHLDSLCAYISDVTEAQTHYPVIFGEFSLGVNTYCVDYQSCVGKSIWDYIWQLLPQDDSLFLRQFWELQTNVFETASGWIFWAAKNEYGAPWSWQQSVAQGWIPKDPSEKLYPYDPAATSSCLDIWQPNGSEPTFPDYPVNLTAMKVDLVAATHISVSLNVTASATKEVKGTRSQAGSPTPSASQSIGQSGTKAELVANGEDSGSHSSTGRAGRSIDVGLSVPLGLAIFFGLWSLS